MAPKNTGIFPFSPAGQRNGSRASYPSGTLPPCLPRTRSGKMEKTETRKLAEEYLRLGGTRKVMIDDNETFVRQWEPEPAEAETFWQTNIESLNEDRLKDVEFFLPSVNSEKEN
jgi:hypothetical protein